MEPDELFDDPVHDDDDDDAAPVDAKNNTGKEDTPQQNPESQQHDGEGTEQQAGLSLYTRLQPPDLGQHLLSYNDGVFCIAPAERNNPVSIFKVPKLEAMAFPVQFPTGENTFDEPHRRTALSPSRYFNARLFSADNRFARDTNYIFFAQFVTEMHLATSSMSIQLRKAKSMTRDGCRINSALLQDKQELDKLVRNNEGSRFMQPLRGTPAYWEKTLRSVCHAQTVGNSHLLLDIQCCRDEMARDDSAVRMSLPMKCLQDKDPDDENVWMTGLAEKYMARPNTPEFENMCMAEFASEYRIVYAGQRKGKNVSVLQNNMGHIKKAHPRETCHHSFCSFLTTKTPRKILRNSAETVPATPKQRTA
ncbi:hypothetical protein SRHO_G00340200 [Serrasalmus rhombeus]